MPRIFISYRRADSEIITGRIHDHLERDFGARNVFKDVDDIEIGADFRKVLHDAITQCEVVLVIIGPRWSDIRDSSQNRRLNDPNDFVRIEVETAIQNGSILVVPVLVQGAQMPAADDLPESLKNFAYLNAAVIRNDPDFNRDMERLTARLRQIRQRSGLPRWLLPAGALVVLAAVAAALVFASQPRAGTPTATPASDAMAASPTTPPPSESPPPTAAPSSTPVPTEAPSLTPAPTTAPLLSTGPTGRIVYIVPGFILTSSVDGLEIARVPIDSVNIAAAKWSPDGSRIAYMSWDGGVYIMDKDGTNVVELVKHIGESYIGPPIWSVDGERLAFIGDVHDPPESDPNAEVYVINVDGSNLRRVTNEQGQDWPAYWLEDGRIVFTRFDVSQEHYAMNVDGTERVRVDNYGVDSLALPSPDGKQVVANIFDPESATYEIYILNADGSNLRRLTENSVMDGYIGWSPDSQYLLFFSGEPEALDLYIMKADGSDVRQITNTGNVIGSVWLP